MICHVLMFKKAKECNHMVEFLVACVLCIQTFVGLEGSGPPIR